MAYDVESGIQSTPQSAEPSLAEAVVPVPVEVLEYVATSLLDFEALWQNEAGSTTLLDSPRRKLLLFDVVESIVNLL